jgi:phospholipid/cholesterol/gamma-HCH transport system substrate-binding protein
VLHDQPGGLVVRAALLRPLTGLATVSVIAGVVALAVTLFNDGFADAATVTVLSPRAGLVMNPDAKVQFHGVQVGRVSSIDDLADGQAALKLAMDPARLPTIPANVMVDIASPTVFGAKSVRLVLPDDPSREAMQPGQVLNAGHVMVEANTVFEELVRTLSSIEPEKLNETLGAIAAATNDRGAPFGQAMSDLNSALGQINPHLSALNADLALAPGVIGTYADVAPSLVSIAQNATRLSHTVVDEQHTLDAALVSAIGLANIGTEVLHDNGGPLADVLHLMTPTTDLTNQYNQALYCALGAMKIMANNPPLKEPGVPVLTGFLWGQERYRYPGDLPKVAATGGPQCTDLPRVPFGKVPPFVISDVGTNPWKYDNPGIVLNSDGLKRLLFGPADGPPRNSAQIGQPG